MISANQSAQPATGRADRRAVRQWETLSAVRRGWGRRAADRRAAAGARARDGGEGSPAAVAGAAEGECVRPAVRALPP